MIELDVAIDCRMMEKMYMFYNSPVSGIQALKEEGIKMPDKKLFTYKEIREIIEKAIKSILDKKTALKTEDMHLLVEYNAKIKALHDIGNDFFITDYEYAEGEYTDGSN